MKPLQTQTIDMKDFADDYSTPLSRDLFWRQCDLKPLLNQAWPVVEKLQDIQLADEYQSLENAVVFINGEYSAEYSSVDIAVKTIDAQLLSEDEAKQPKNFFAMLNQKAAAPAYQISLHEKNHAVPVKIYQLFTVEQAQMIPLQLNVHAQSGFKGVLEFHYHCQCHNKVWLNQQLDFQLDAYAEVTALEFTDKSCCLSLTNIVQANLAEKALLRQFTANKHFEFLYCQQDVYLNELSAKWDIAGFYILKQKQHAHYRLKAHHLNKNTQSNQCMRGMLSDQSWALFDSSVIVERGAKGSESAQMNNNLLLGDKAKVQSFPILEIDEDDVVCSHGSTIGAFDEAMLFYLQSRGLSIDASFSLMKRAFISEVIRNFDQEKVLPQLQSYMQHKA
jgi:Fe-S cluster assembly protein SufD